MLFSNLFFTLRDLGQCYENDYSFLPSLKSVFHVQRALSLQPAIQFTMQVKECCDIIREL